MITGKWILLMFQLLIYGTSTVNEKYNIDTIYSPVILDLFSAMNLK